MSGTLETVNNPFEFFLVAFSGVLHETINHTNKKENIISNMNKINETVD